MTRLGSAFSRSILLMATTIGTPADLAWSMASMVWGMTPSSAATTRMTMSVASAPRARMAVNASWPGVSMKVTSPAVLDDLVGADVLGDAACLAFHDVGAADAVEQQGLAVVDVAHDGDDGRTLLEVGLVLVLGPDHLEQELERLLLLGTGIDEPELGSDLVGEQLDHLVAQGLRGGDHLALGHQVPDDVGGRAVELGADLLRRRAPLEDDLAVGHRSVDGRVGADLLRLQLLELAAPPAGAARWASTACGAGSARATAGASGGATGTAGTAGTASGPADAGAGHGRPWPAAPRRGAGTGRRRAVTAHRGTATRPRGGPAGGAPAAAGWPCRTPSAAVRRGAAGWTGRSWSGAGRALGRWRRRRPGPRRGAAGGRVSGGDGRRRRRRRCERRRRAVAESRIALAARRHEAPGPVDLGRDRRGVARRGRHLDRTGRRRDRRGWRWRR